MKYLSLIYVMGKSTDISRKNMSIAAVDILAKNLNMTYEQVAKEIGVSKNTIGNWMANPNFIDKVYNRYMEIAGAEIPYVIQAMIEEARLGNVNAAKLILEQFGKLENKMTIVHESNFEKFMKSSNNSNAENADWFEVTSKDEEVIDIIEDKVGDKNLKLPNRHISNDNPKLRDDFEKARLNAKTKKQVKDMSEKDKQAERYIIRKRAKAVGLELLGSGRHTKTERDAWMRKLEELENEI
jgi:transcriptional regulator with XRE-family HTH domain